MDYREEFSSLFVKQEEHTLRGTLRNLAPRVLPFKVIESDTDDFLLTLIPATGVKILPVHFCLCISKTVRDIAMRFCGIVPDSDGYLSHINFCHIAAVNVNRKPEVHFRKSAKSRMPDSIVSDYKQPRSKMQYAPRNLR